ncbi:MAG: phosphotransferase [Lachnospiraceae bacterium]
MNLQEYEIMNEIMRHTYINQRELAECTGYSVGKVNQSIKVLVREGYLNNAKELTEKAQRELDEKRPKNAIILAAGYGMRMIPINVEVPKGLLEIKGESLIDRIICQLHEVGVTEIDVVVGFMKEQYEYLIDKYHVNLIFNKDYMTKNNLHSLCKVADRLGNTYIIPCDIWSEYNPFSRHEWYSWYMITNQIDDRSSVRTNRKKELVNIKREESGNTMIGISYILFKEAEILKKRLKDLAGKKEYDQAFWELALSDRDRMLVFPKEVDGRKVHEINTYEQLRELDCDSDHLQSDVIQLISNVFSCEATEITDIRSLKKGMTNRSFIFKCKGKQYIMRIPGEGTGKMIDRNHEYAVYEQLEGENITDPVVYMSPENGYKITEYIEDTHTCDSMNDEDVKRCMEYLKGFHNLKLQVKHEFDLFGQIEYYESLWGREKSAYRDYQMTKERIYSLKNYIDKQPKQWALTHIDAVCDNFLMKEDKIYLIDWEYAGMQDVHVDIAMFAIYSMYDREHIDRLIDFYFEGEVSRAVRIKIYCYIAICGLLWSNWCEYKRICGVEFGEYSLKQYRYAKEYYRIVEKMLGEGEFKNV